MGNQVHEQINQNNSLMQKHSIYIGKCDSDYGEKDDYCVALFSDIDNFRKVEPVNLQVQFVKIKSKALLGSCSVCKIVHQSLAGAKIEGSIWAIG